MRILIVDIHGGPLDVLASRQILLKQNKVGLLGLGLVYINILFAF